MADQEQVDRLKSDVNGWNEWRRNQKDRPIDLSEAFLPTVTLIGADLSRADLSRADLSDARLGDANLRDANFRDACLGGANLYRADLRGADLRSANLNSANLHDVNFSGADLRGANLKRARLIETVFGNVDLTNAKNLESCNHRGPSTIDLRTLERSSRLPDVFLRGCGLSDRFIKYYLSLPIQAIGYYSCFISYSHADKSYAQQLNDALESRGISC